MNGGDGLAKNSAASSIGICSIRPRSQNPRRIAISFAVSENVAVPLSAATTRYGSSASCRTTCWGGTTWPDSRLSVTSSIAEMNIR